MNAWMFSVILKTLPKIDANKFEETKVILKPRKEWEMDIWKYSATFIVFLLCFLLLSRVPYAAPFFFLAGFLGMIFSFLLISRAVIVYKNYDDLFSKDEVAKLGV